MPSTAAAEYQSLADDHRPVQTCVGERSLLISSGLLFAGILLLFLGFGCRYGKVSADGNGRRSCDRQSPTKKINTQKR